MRKKLFSNKKIIFLSVVLLLIFSAFGYFTIDVQALNLNFGTNYTIIHIILHVLVSLLIIRIILLQLRKIQIYKKNLGTEKFYKKNKSGFLSAIGTTFGILITGCPVCGRTLMSALGLSYLLSFLPWYGLELKVLAVFLLFWAQDILVFNLENCQIFKLKNRIKQKKIIASIFLMLISFPIIFFLIQQKNIVKLPGKAILIPSSDYTIFSYEQSLGCSNTSFFIESYTKTSNQTKILGVYSYDSISIENFEKCKYPGIQEDMDQNQFQKILENYKILEAQTKIINSTKYLIEYENCKDYQFDFCLQGTYFFVKNKVIHKTIVQTSSQNPISISGDYQLLDGEISKRSFY